VHAISDGARKSPLAMQGEEHCPCSASAFWKAAWMHRR
jgi:hypothetical protein